MSLELNDAYGDDLGELAESLSEILERDSRRYSGFRETEAEN